MPDLEERNTPTAPPSNGNLEELQTLLLKKERYRLDELEADRVRLDRLEAERGRLDQLEDGLNKLDDDLKNKVVDATAVAKVLPDAIRQRSTTKQDQDLEESLELIFVSTFKRTVINSRDDVVKAISPVMGPAIRKYIEDVLQGMVRTLDHSGLSWRGMTWRWEAWRTGRSFGDVVISHTVKYHVERVFLFFREDGVHLADVHLSDAPAFESGHEDLVTSMFSAIKTAWQKFTQDEFQVSEHSAMKEIKMDGKTVLIEQGPKAVLAAVVRGIPPSSLRSKLQNALDSIHVELSEALQNFQGDKGPFEAAKPHLESCLLYEESDSSNEKVAASGGLSPALAVFLILVVGSLALWGITSYLEWQQGADEKQRWAEFQEKVREKPGIHITSIENAKGQNGRTIVYGLQDPLSDDPKEIAKEAGLSAEAIDFQLEQYQSLEPELRERRARDNRRRLDELIQEIKKYQFDFEAGSASLVMDSESALQKLHQALRKSDTLALQLGHRVRVEIHGNTTEEGSAELNHRLALARAKQVLSALNVERFLATDFRSVAESVGSSAAAETQGSKSLRARRVSFYVMVEDFGSAGAR